MKAKFADEATGIRSGEEIDSERLRDYLQSRAPELSGPLAIQQFPRGHSNLTYLVRAKGQDWVLRRPPFGSQVQGAHDMGREYRILSRLSAVFPKAPRPLLYCDDTNILGAPFYLMERREGIILRSRPPEGMVLDAELMRAICLSFIDSFAELHAIDIESNGFTTLGKPEGYTSRQVLGWARRHEQAQTSHLPDLEAISAWLSGRIPRESGASLVHNDYKLDNLVLDIDDPSQIIGVLDWEMSTIGDPLMDLGTSLAYWVEAGDPEELREIAFGPTMLRGALTREEIVSRYEERSGRQVTDPLYYYVFGIFKVAVILQQIYFRYRQGLTRDPRFQSLGESVHILGRAGARALDLGRI